MMDFIESKIPGCYEVLPKVFKDQRGQFVKTYHGVLFEEKGLNTEWREEYYSVSQQGVLRGLHFQLPPHDHEKLVYCTAGKALDLVLDLRVGSPTYKEHAVFDLSAIVANMVYIPRGCAHGFFTLSESATMMYKVATVYSAEHDEGIHWNSVGFQWPDDNPILSERDKAFCTLENFSSPFRFV